MGERRGGERGNEIKKKAYVGETLIIPIQYPYTHIKCPWPGHTAGAVDTTIHCLSIFLGGPDPPETWLHSDARTRPRGARRASAVGQGKAPGSMT